MSEEAIEQVGLHPQHPAYRLPVEREVYERGQRAIAILRQHALDKAVAIDGGSGKSATQIQYEVEQILNIMLRS